MATRSPEFDFDFIVIGSGFGGSVSALRLVEKGYRVAVIEMGRRWAPLSFPRTSWSIHRWFWRPKLGLHGFFNMRFFRHATIFHGCAVGGGSITYAGTLLPPPDKVWQSGSWAGLADWKSEMPRHYQTASRMLGVTQNQILGPADQLLKRTGEIAGSGHTFYCTRVGIFQAAEGEPANQTFPDPFFGGEGPPRTTCTGCGGCMMGCRFGAKNTLDLNYLYLAENYGAVVFPETKVVNVKPLVGASDGGAGYEVRTVNSTAWIRQQPREVHLPRRCLLRIVAGYHGTAFPAQRKRLVARHQRASGQTRAHEFGIDHRGARTRGVPRICRKALPSAPASTSTNTRTLRRCAIPCGSDTMGLLTTMLTDGRPGLLRIGLWLKNMLGHLLLHPVKALRLFRPWGWAREATILLCMQAVEGHIEMRWQRPWFWPFSKMLVSRGDKVPTYIPKANEFARKFAQVAGGTAMSMLPEILFDIPGTAHCIGGCVIAGSPEQRRGGRSPARLRLSQHVHLRRIGSGGKSRRQSKPDHHRAGRARDESDSFRERNGMERRSS